MPSSTTTVQSFGAHYEQQNISAVSQPSDCVTIVSDAHTGISTSSPIVTSNECPITISIDASENNGESVSTVTTTVGMYDIQLYDCMCMCVYVCMYVCTYVRR